MPGTPLDDLDRLTALHDTGLLDSPREADYDRLTHLACRLLSSPIALISLVDDHRQFFKSAQGLPEAIDNDRQTPLSHSFCQHVVTTGQDLVVEHAQRHEIVCHNPAIQALDIGAYLGTPILGPNGALLGSLCVIDHQPRTWTIAEQENLRALSEVLSNQITLRVTSRRLAASLAEKDTLLHEVHHRVKNNLQLVMSLFKLQANHPENSDPSTLFAESQRRLHSIALMHEMLYAHPSLTHLQLDRYLEQLTQHAIRSFSTRQRPVHLQLDAEPLTVTPDLAIPLGLIVNELLTNACKHGGQAEQELLITLRLRRSEPHAFELDFSDNGPGIRSSGTTPTEGLGERLIVLLSRQIRAKLCTPAPDGPARYTLLIPVSTPTQP